MTRRRSMSAAGACVAALALSGCWPVPGQNADNTAHNPFERALTPATVGALEQLWSADAGPGQVGPPIVQGSGVIVTAGGRSVQRFDVATGEPDWTWALDDELGIATVGDPFAVDDRILVGHGLGNLGGHWTGTWLDPATGTSTGVAPVGGLVEGVRGTRAASTNQSFGSGTPVVAGFRLVDLETGAGEGGMLSVTEGTKGTGPGALTLGTDLVYHAGYGLVPPAEPGGAWTFGDAVRAFPASGVTTDCGYSGFACPVWVTPVDGTPSAAVLGGGGTTVYVGTASGVAALDAATGAVLWTADVGAPAGTPALAGGVLFVPTTSGDVVAVAAGGCGAGTCAPLWRASTGTAAVTRVSVGGDGDDAVVYAGTEAGDVVAVAAAGCGQAVCSTPLWRANTGSAIRGGPVVTGGRVFVGTADGRLVAFGLPAG